MQYSYKANTLKLPNEPAARQLLRALEVSAVSFACGYVELQFDGSGSRVAGHPARLAAQVTQFDLRHWYSHA